MDLFLKLFLNIILNNEFEETTKKCKKWKKDIKLFIFFEKYVKDLDDEANNIIQEINEISDTIKIYRTNNFEESTMKVFLSSANIFMDYLPINDWKYLENNYGFATIFYNHKFIIKRALIYVDIYRTKKIECQKHLLREEITQSLGLVNDINMRNSIFNQNWECTTEYTNFDKMIIKLFMSKKIKSGMNKDEIIEMYKSNIL